MDVQAITALKKGAQLLKYGRRGKPKFCPFRLSNVRFPLTHVVNCNFSRNFSNVFTLIFQDESVLVWYSGKDEKQLKISQVSKIIPGQRTV